MSFKAVLPTFFTSWHTQKGPHVLSSLEAAHWPVPRRAERMVSGHTCDTVPDTPAVKLWFPERKCHQTLRES